MKLVFILFALAIVLELIVPIVWRARKVIAGLCLIITAFASGALLAWRPNVLSSLIVLASAYRVINNVRLVKGRMHTRYLRRTTFRTSLVLSSIQAALIYVWWQWYQTPVAYETLWLCVVILQLSVAVVVLASTVRRLKRTRPQLEDKHWADNELPSITIAIPARNETEDLQTCLESIIANDYPKFEVLVLDDCSQNKRTPEIIRSFAHDGVRFLQGDQPSDTWLPKNQAYNQLVREASGEYILFCGADIRFEPNAIRKIVTMVHLKDKDMISILPLRVNGGVEDKALIQAMRYWWELAPPRRLFNRPSVISSAWVARKTALEKAGGFAAVARSIVPEAYFAKRLVATDGYSFVRSDTILGVESSKAAKDQRDTAIRVRYPQLHRRPEQVFMTTILEAGLLLMPFVIALFGAIMPLSSWAQLLAAAAGALHIAAYVCIALATRINTLPFALVAFPAMVAIDLGLLQKSMWQYEFSEVIWKGRNVCIPVMHVTPHLPKLR
jgi:glycosyltransferase involved in cell wall biosynthesis